MTKLFFLSFSLSSHPSNLCFSFVHMFSFELSWFSYHIFQVFAFLFLIFCSINFFSFNLSFLSILLKQQQFYIIKFNCFFYCFPLYFLSSFLLFDVPFLLLFLIFRFIHISQSLFIHSSILHNMTILFIENIYSFLYANSVAFSLFSTFLTTLFSLHFPSF